MESYMAIPIISVIGWHNVGKTTFVVRLVEELKRQGLRVATVKHSRGHFDLDHEGTDTWRFAQAGSDVVAIVGHDRLAMIESTPEEPTLDSIVARLPQDLDIIIAEGFKREPTRKIEVIVPGKGEGRISRPDELLAIVSEACTELPDDAPCFLPSDAAGVVELLQAQGIIRQAQER
jgi:molybdopterin-guanine dinucleotide biosynthesis protein B